MDIAATQTTHTITLPSSFTHTSPPPHLLALGAEAHVYRTHFLTPSNPCILKYRPSKPYRHPILDARLTRHRILSEARTLVKCRREGVSVPGVLALSAEEGWMMEEWIEGGTVKERLQKRRDAAGTKVKEGGKAAGELEDELLGLMRKIGEAVGRMHKIGVVHGDLTTSNLMLREESKEAVNGEITEGVVERQQLGHVNQDLVKDQVNMQGEVILIDYGLAGQSIQDEDKAVDLYVLERAFGSTHPEVEEGFKEVLRAYGESYKGAKVVLKRLEDVRMRGRKRSMIG